MTAKIAQPKCRQKIYIIYNKIISNFCKLGVLILKIKNAHWVSEIITDDYKHWKQGVVIISAQTGTGKTSFILNQLLPYAVKNNRKILYLCNRTALVQQIESELEDKEILYEGMKTSRKRKADCTQASEAYIKIISYQKSEYTSIESEIINFGAYYVVFDEAHYYYQDSQLNAGTQKICSYLFQGQMNKTFSNCVNVFMSATDDYVYLLLARYYCKSFIKSTTNARQILMQKLIPCYTTKFNYNYFKPYYFLNYREIIEAIISTPRQEKWLIFVSSLNKAEQLLLELNLLGYETVHSKKDLSKSSLSCAIVSSKTKNSYTYKELIETEKFSCNVLLATSVIDNGVNIHDNALKHIVVPAVLKTQFLQLIGRKRINQIENEKVNLYIQGFQKKSVSCHLKLIKKKLKFIDDFNIRNNPDQYRGLYLKDLKDEEANKSLLKYASRNDPLALSFWQNRLDRVLKSNPSFLNLLLIDKNFEYTASSVLSGFSQVGKILPEVEINTLAEFNAHFTEEFYSNLQNTLNDNPNSGPIITQLKWLGFEYNEMRWLSNIRFVNWKNTINDSLESIIHKPLNKEKQLELIEKLTHRLEVDLGEKSTKIPKGKNGIHKLFIREHIPYHIECILEKRSRKTLWIIEKGLPEINVKENSSNLELPQELSNQHEISNRENEMVVKIKKNGKVQHVYHVKKHI